MVSGIDGLVHLDTSMEREVGIQVMNPALGTGDAKSKFTNRAWAGIQEHLNTLEAVADKRCDT